MSQRTESSQHFDTPSLFVRANRIEPAPQPTRTEAPAPTPVTSVLDAFLGYAEMRLAEHTTTPRGHRFRTPATVAQEHLRQRGFSEVEIREIHFGLYTSPQDVHDHLRRMGFSETAIRESGLVYDADGRPRHDWSGNVVVPLAVNQDVYCFDPQNPSDARFLRGPNVDDVAAYGIDEAREALPQWGRLLLVEDVVDAIYLRRHGLPETAATGCPPAQFTPQRWRALVRDGVESVTLAFSHDGTRERRIREALSHALVARTAPEVYVVDGRVLRENDSAAECVRHFGAERLRTAIRNAQHAFGSKDYGRGREPFVERPARRPHEYWAGDEAVARFRAYLVGEIDKIARPAERAAWHAFLVDVESALHRGEFARARTLVDDWYTRLHPRAEPRPTSPAGTLGDVLTSIRAGGRREQVEIETLDASAETVDAYVETIAVASRSGRLQAVCERLSEAIRTNPEGRHVVLCREFTPRTIAFGLLCRLANELTDGPGLDAEQVWDRFVGRDDQRGYDDRPWIVDEAVDRLRRSFDCVEFVEPTTGDEVPNRWVERFADGRALTSVTDAAGPVEQASAWNAMHWEAAEAARVLDCSVTIVTNSTVELTPVAYRFEPEWKNWCPTCPSTDAEGPTHRGFHEVVREWIDYAESHEPPRFAF